MPFDIPAKLRNLFITTTQPPLDAYIRSATAGYAREADQQQTIRNLAGSLAQLQAQDQLRKRREQDNGNELQEALHMGGAGPWRMPGAESGTKGLATLRESQIAAGQGAYGDAELWLQNVEWQREANMSWLEFTRWGIQQIILIARLRFIKDPMLQRGVNVSAQYVFGRGVEVSSTDGDANDVLKDFFERNRRTIGQIALAELERSKYYDGNIFHVLFTDKENSGEVSHRTIDATEIMEIITDPDDAAMPWFYRRDWIQKQFDPKTGSFESQVSMKAWYPALSYEPPEMVEQIGGIPVFWNSPVLHRKAGGIGKWLFGLPLIFPALGYAKAVKNFLEDCMTIRNSLAQYSMTLTMKGGQQAMAGAKQQLSTTVGPNASLWDQNPTAVTGSIFSSGPGTKLEAFNTKGAGGDPAEVREYKLQVAMVFGCPESFWSDMNTSNLATATSLDRPTELNFMEKQESWREDLVTIGKYVLKSSYHATNGKLREAVKKRAIDGHMLICEAARIRASNGVMVYETENAKPNEVTVMVTFPSIIESDVPANIGAIVSAMTLGNKQGNVLGIDEKEGIRLLYQEIGVADSQEVLEAQYPSNGPDKYDPLRTVQPVDVTEPDDSSPDGDPATAKESGAVRAAIRRLSKAFHLYEAVKHNETDAR